MIVNVLLDTGKHTMDVPLSLGHQIRDILVCAKLDGDWTVKVGANIKGSHHTRGVRLAGKEFAHCTRLICQPGDNKTRFVCDLITRSGIMTREVRERVALVLANTGTLPIETADEEEVAELTSAATEEGASIGVSAASPLALESPDDQMEVVRETTLKSSVPENLTGFEANCENVKSALAEMVTAFDRDSTISAHMASLAIRMVAGLTKPCDHKEEERLAKMAGAARRRLTKEGWLEVVERNNSDRPIKFRFSPKAYELIGRHVPPSVTHSATQPASREGIETILTGTSVEPQLVTLVEQVRLLKEKVLLRWKARERLDFVKQQERAAADDVKLFREKLEEAQARLATLVTASEQYERALNDPIAEVAERELELILSIIQNKEV